MLLLPGCATVLVCDAGMLAHARVTNGRGESVHQGACRVLRSAMYLPGVDTMCLPPGVEVCPEVPATAAGGCVEVNQVPARW